MTDEEFFMLGLGYELFDPNGLFYDRGVEIQEEEVEPTPVKKIEMPKYTGRGPTLFRYE